MIPTVTVKKGTGGGTPALNTVDGILAIIASCSTGTNLPPTLLSTQSAAQSSFGNGMLPECSVFDIDVSGKPVLAVPYASGPSIAGSYGSITQVVTGSGVVSAGATQPLLHYNPIIKVTSAFTAGGTGGAFTYSLDGGISTIGPVVQPASTTLTVPNSGVSFSLTGNFAPGDTWSCFTERPLGNNADVTTALATLKASRLPWEGVLVDCAYSTGTVGLLDAFLVGLQARGQFCFGILNTRFLNEPCPTGEASGVYSAAILAQTATDASANVCVCADGGRYTSLMTGFTTKFPTSLALAAMTMAQTPNIGTDPAEVDLGPVPDFQITSNGNPLDWDEGNYQSLDAGRLTTLRTFAPGGPQGTFITNANVLIPAGSNVYWIQLLRCLNKAARIAFQVMSTQLSKGVRTVFNSTTNKLNIDTRDAMTLEDLVEGPVAAGLSGQVTATGVTVHTDDDLTAPGAPLNSDVGIVPKVYLKNLVVTVALVRTISVPTGGA